MIPFTVPNLEAKDVIKDNQKLINLALALYKTKLRTREDLVSVVHTSLMYAHQTYDPKVGSSFKHYFLTCVKHDILTEHEKYYNRDIRNMDRDEELDQISHEESITDDIIIDLDSQLNKLNSVDKKILMLKFTHDLTEREIGDIMGMTDSAVGYRIRAAIKWLHSNLNKPRAHKKLSSRDYLRKTRS